MKIKFSLQRPAGSVDLVATVDSATTVADLANHLIAVDPAGYTAPADNPTLTVHGTKTAVLDPRQPVADSELASGSVVTIGQAGTSYVETPGTAAAVVRILSGPDQGRDFRLAAGTSIIGREPGCEVRLSDTSVSRRHARLNITDGVEIIDLGSANGVQIDDIAVPRSILRAADVVEIGETTLSVRRLPSPNPARTENESAGLAFVRSPRLDPVYAGRMFEAPDLPERERRQRFPFIPLMAPLLMGALLYLITGSIVSIVFVALSPIMLIGSAIESRLAGRSEHARAVKEFRAEVDALVGELRAAAETEARERRAEQPDAASCLDAVARMSPLLWSRRPGERGFAELNLGLGRETSRQQVKLGSSGKSSRALRAELETTIEPLLTVDRVPITAALADGALGLAGPRVHVLPAARALLLQLVALHSPAELVITALATSSTAPDWDWLKWLPHTSSPSSPLRARHLAASPAVAAATISDLEDLLADRQDNPRSAPATPSVVVLIEADAPVAHNRLAGLAEHGPAIGVHVLWLAGELPALPAACRTFVEITGDGRYGTVGRVDTGESVAPVALDRLEEQEALRAARTLAPVTDRDAALHDASDLPLSVPLLALTGTDIASSADAVLERWTENRSIVSGPLAPAEPVRHAGSLRAVIGQSAGELHALDLRADGPHALVGGTTGAGKSELLQAWILAMAAAHSPQRLTFLLVDYKGGSAFRDCVDLPHTVGLVTDLSPHLVRRVLTSLSAELRYREHVLAAHAAKDLASMERQGIADAPPSLVIVVDEFAALVSEVPEFVDGVVNVAQRGRSLGLHLILATQRPAGVIKDNLRANTNLRVALRMADEADSTDVLGAPEAAYFDPGTPGRAISKTGPGRLIPFQAGYAGGWTSAEPPPPQILIEELTFGAGGRWELPEHAGLVPADPGATDIRRIVASVRAASTKAAIGMPRIPWLPELADTYDLRDRDRVPSRRTDDELVFGVRDDPDNQAQPTVAFRPDRAGNLAVYGTGGSGKSALLRTIAVAAGFTVHGGPCHVYGIDFGARGLAMIEPLPHVGTVVSGSDHERITRLLTRLRGMIDERALRYSRVDAGTITEYRRVADQPAEPRILLLVDGVAAFRQAYESADRMRWFEMFSSIAADGRPVGVHVVLSSEQRAGVPPSLAASVQSRVVLRLAAADDYPALGVAADVLRPDSPPGRGLLGDEEVQVAVLGGSADPGSQALAIRRFAASMRRAGVTTAPSVGALPESVSLTSLPAQVGGRLVLGVGGGALAPFGVETRGSFVITGPPGGGRSTALQTLVEALQRADETFEMYYFGSRRSPLAALPVWRARGVGSDAAQAAAALASELVARPAGAPRVAVVVEAISEFVNGLVDPPLQEVAKACLAEDHFFVSESEASTLGSSFGLLGYAKSSRAGLALQPDQADGTTIFRTTFPRIDRSEYPPGRALLVNLGRTEVVQVALSPP